MSKIKWLTKEEVREYATTPARALDISIKHHQQNVDATEEELDKQFAPLAEDLCGLCWYYRKGNSGSCDKCPLGQDTSTCFQQGSLYQEVRAQWSGETKNHESFIKAETALLNRLKQLRAGDKSTDKKRKLEIKIEQTEKAAKAIADEAEQLQSQLAALAEPELRRRGDYGIVPKCTHGKNRPVIIDRWRSSWIDLASENDSIVLLDTDKVDAVILGNLVDDLAALAKPLEEFEVQGIRCKIKGVGSIDMNGYTITPLDKQEEFHRNLGRLIATAKKRAAK